MDLMHNTLLHGFGPLFKGSLSQVAVPGTLLGFLFHITIAQTRDIEEYTFILIGTLTLVVSCIASTSYLLGSAPLDVLARMSVLAISFNASLFSSMALYRLFFHRLRKFPGPSDVKISRFFTVLRAAKKIQYHKEIARMHEQYGDIFRTGPRELCVIRGSAIPAIYGLNSKCRKSPWYAQAGTNPKEVNVLALRDSEAHKRRRRIWDRALSIKALSAYQLRVIPLVNEFVRQVSQRKGPLDVTAWSMYLTFDVMGEVGFGKDFGCVSSGEEHRAIRALREHMTVSGVMNHVPWLLNILRYIPIVTAGYAPFFDYCRSQTEAKWKSLDLEKDPQDIMSWLLRAAVEKDNPARSIETWAHEDSRMLIVAGSDTSAGTLAQALFYLAKFPSVLKKLQAQVDAAMPDPTNWTYENVKSITYLDNVIEETLRLKPAVMSGMSRETPPEGIWVDEQHIPGDTIVFVPLQLIQTHPRYWQQSADFIPERFGERSVEMRTKEAPYMPFSSGVSACPGKNLALMTLRLAISNLVRRFDISFAPGETGEEFDKESKDVFTTLLPPLMLQFSPRK